VPELPEVETVARQLDPLVRGRRIRALRIADSRLRPGPGPDPRGQRVCGVRRIGKQVAIATAPAGSEDTEYLLVHLRMTGRLLWRPAAREELVPPVRASLDLQGGSLLFSDVRRFGTMRWCKDPQDALNGAMDPLSPKLTARRLAALLEGSAQPLKSWLLRQDRLVGIGNIYASEIPFAAGVSPMRPAGSLDPGEIRRLHRALRRVLRRAIEACGTTFSDFQDANGVTGTYQSMLSVYARTGEPCRRCGEPIARLVQQQRSTFHCPVCQV
jgi:formamidopyrimidine-DNA glycosylase